MRRRNPTNPGDAFWLGLLFVAMFCFISWAVWEGMGREIRRMEIVAQEYQELAGPPAPLENIYPPTEQ